MGGEAPQLRHQVRAAARELAQARAARSAAEAAWCDIEELLWEMQHSPRVWRRLAQTNIAEPERLVRAH